MTNKEITKVIFNNAEISALYYGDVLVWEKENTEEYGVNTFAGKFTDDSTESDWFWKPNNNKISIADKVDPTTKEFNFDYKLTYYNPTLVSVDKIEKIYHFPDTSNITSMYQMFKICKALTSIDLSNFNTSSVTDMGSMFGYCYALTTLDLTSFDTSKVTNMYSMFYNCYKLTKVTGVFEGTKVDLDLHYSPLTNESAMVFINGLANVGETKTIKFKSTTYNTLTAEQIAIATSKGWTVISI